MTCGLEAPPPGSPASYTACDGQEGGGITLSFTGPEGFTECDTNGSQALTEVGYCPTGTFCQVALVNLQTVLAGHCQ